MGRVVVTGGAGFLGSHLSEALLARGDEVVVLDNLVTGSVDNIEHLFGRRGFTFAQHDVSSYVWVPGDVDAVMHLASPASPVDYLDKPIQTLKVGSLGTHNSLGLAKAKNARFFLASTSEVYGDPQVHPQPETYWGHVNPVGPRGVYDEAKRFAEAMTMAYHRYHGLEVRIVRIFNSILAGEMVLYDDGHELRHETVEQAAARLGLNADLHGVHVPAFDEHCNISGTAAVSLVGHPTSARCFEVRTRYGRSIKVTGDHSLFVSSRDGRPVARPVRELAVGDHVAIARRLDLAGRDRQLVSIVDMWDASGRDPWQLVVRSLGLGERIWQQRFEAFRVLEREQASSARAWRSALWARISRMRASDEAPLALLRALGHCVPSEAVVRPKSARGGGTSSLPHVVHLSDDLLWALGLYVAEGCWSDTSHDAFITVACDEERLDRFAKIVEAELGLHCVRAPSSPRRSGAVFVHSRLLLALLGHLGFGPGDKCIPGWVLGLPLARLGEFIEGYREGDGVHSGKKLAAGVRHEFSTTSPRLKDDLVVAFARFGLVASVGRYRSRIATKDPERWFPFWRLTLANVSPWSPREWSAGVAQRLNARVDGDIVWATVKEITPIPATDLVYDFSVPGRENFWAGGVMAHNTYGPRMRPNDGRVVSNFLVQALEGKPLTIYGDGSQTRSFCYVDDEVRGFLSLLDGPITGPCNIGNPGEFTMLELAAMVREVTGSSSEIVYEPLPVDDPTQRKPDITMAREHLGWEPTIQLREGLTKTADYFRTRLGL